MQLHLLNARDIAREVNAGRLEAPELAAALCARIERLDPVLNAFVDYDRAAVIAEAEAVARRVRAGEVLPLAGVPFTVKDNLWLGGRRATFGSRLFADFVAPRDAWCVARLRRLGALPLGVTNCSEFACKGVTTNPLHGTTRNPWDLARTPGGSSGGAVAAVAAGLGPLALATDAGGSTRRPAAHTGLVGFKPSLGAVPNPWGFDDPNHLLSVIGQVGRDVADVALMARSLYDWVAEDPLSQPVFGPRLLDADGCDPRTLRIAWSPDLGCGFPVDAAVADAFAAAIERLRERGWRIETASPAWPAGMDGYALLALQQAGLAALFGDALAADGARFDPDIAAQIELGRQIPGTVTAAMLQLRDRLGATLARFFADHDLLLCPTAPVEAWAADRLGPAEIGGRPAGPRGHAGFTPIFNYCGVPALSLPCGVGAAGLPVGMQVVGARYADGRVLAAAAAMEEALGLRFESPMLLAD